MNKCQCPLGLIPHCYGDIIDIPFAQVAPVSMPSRAYTSLLQRRAFNGTLVSAGQCQCPLGLIPHCYVATSMHFGQAMITVSMPSRAYTSLLHKHCNAYGYSRTEVSMPSRAYTSLLQYPFKNLGFMRFPEPIFAGICQNILIITHFHAC